MQIRVKPDRCQGHNRCCSLVPDLFDIDDDGMSQALNESHRPKNLEQNAQLAVDHCPEFIVEILYERTSRHFPAVSRDPAAFDRPDAMVLNRKRNPHLAFEVAIYRCPGSNLTHMEMEVALRV